MNFRRSSAYKQYQQRSFQMSTHNKDSKQNMFRKPRSLKRKSSSRSLNGSVTSTSSRSKVDTKLANQDSVTSSKKDQEQQANSSRSETRNFQIESTAKLLLAPNKNCCSVSLLYFSYFTAIYALTAYGITSLLSIYELVMHSNQNYVPLYILVIGYITITLMSVNLLIAIHKDYISIILCWIVTLSVFILPEIALNIVLCETVLEWFNTTTGSYMTIMLIIRITVDIPCIALVLLYYINRTKRENHLKQILKPIKQEIKNGEILKRYEEIRIDNNNKTNGIVKEDKNYLYINGKSSKKYQVESLLNDQNQTNNVSDQNSDENKNSYEPKIYHFTPNNKSMGYLKPKEDALDYTGSIKEPKLIAQTTIINESLDNKKSLYTTSNQSFSQQQQQQNQTQANQSKNSFKNSVIFDSSANTKLLSQKTIQNESPLLCSTNIDDDMIQINYNNIDTSNKSLKHHLHHHVSLNMDTSSNPPTKRVPNLNTYYMYLPSVPSIPSIDKHDSDFQLYNPNEGDIDDHTVLAKIGTSCNCVNITSCASNDPIVNQIIHSTNCIYYKP